MANEGDALSLIPRTPHFVLVKRPEKQQSEKNQKIPSNSLFSQLESSSLSEHEVQ